MAVRQIALTFDPEMLKLIEKHAKKLGFSTSQKYIYELIRRNIHGKGGRPKRKRLNLAEIDPLIPKFGVPTKETYKILRDVRSR